MEQKVCKVCGELKPLEMFKLNPKTKSLDGRVSTCTECATKKRLTTIASKAEAKAEAKLRRELSEFQPRELIAELRRRGYRGELRVEQIVKI